jgi:hypothetical protein
MIGGVDYVVNRRTATNVFTPTIPLLPATFVSASSQEALYTPTTYTWELTPTIAIAQNSILLFTFPSEITLVESSVTCTLTIGGVTAASSAVTILSSNAPVQISISDGFTSDYTTTGTPF